MTNYISNINNIAIGGGFADSEWIHQPESFEVFTSTTFTAGKATTYSLAAFLPNDSYAYECQFDCYIRTGSTSGNFAVGTIVSGTATTIDDNIYAQMCAVRTRSASSRINGGNAILPIYPNDRNVTWINFQGSGTSGNCGLYLKRYRRIGTNN